MAGGGTVIIRPTASADIAALPEVERSAARAFLVDPELAWLVDDAVTSESEHAAYVADGTSWVGVVGGRPVGFLCAEVFPPELHVWELAVREDCQGRGIGRRLMTAAEAFARQRRLAAVTLTTFRELRWNEAFYAGLGFETFPAGLAGPRLEAVLEKEVALGLPGARRCAMRLTLGQAEQPDGDYTA